MLLTTQRRVEEDYRICLLQKKAFERSPFVPGTLVFYENLSNPDRFPFYGVHSYLVERASSEVFDNTPGLTIVLGPIWADPSNELEDIDQTTVYELGFCYLKKATKGMLTAYLAHPKEDWRRLAQAVYKHLDREE